MGPKKARYRGVFQNHRQFGAQIQFRGKRVWLGTFPTAEAVAHVSNLKIQNGGCAQLSREKLGPAAVLNFEKTASVDDLPGDKRRRVGTGRAVVTRGGQPLAPVTNRQDVATNLSGEEGMESVKVEFTKEEVEALLNEKIKGKKFDVKGKMEQMNDQIKRQKQCIKWFQQVEESYAQEKEKLTNTLESAENKCKETVEKMKIKEEEVTSHINELKIKVASLQECVAKEEREKLNIVECHIQEKEARAAAEKLNDSLKVDLAKAVKDEKRSADQKTTLEEVLKQKEMLLNEVGCLRGELQQVREDRDRQVARAQALTSELARIQESIKNSPQEDTNTFLKEKNMINNADPTGKCSELVL